MDTEYHSDLPEMKPSVVLDGSVKEGCTGTPMGNHADFPEIKPSVVLAGSAKECCTRPPMANPADLPEMKPSVVLVGSAKVCCTGPPMGNPADLPETKPSVVLVGSAKECCTGTPVGNPADLPEMKPSVFVVGSAKEACNVPSIGVVDIGVSEDAYLFRVALPGIRNDQSTFKCDIEFDGKVCIHGVVTKSAMQQYFPAGHQMKIQQLCQPGPFSISFTLPGPVNPHLTDLDFRPDGILEVVVIKYKYGKCSTHSEAFSVDGM
ncbi:hypothetical protein JRO89_XS13G0116600 [Xanthoceras sorbifolium]|uniref:SHSP domain-containing protein n=1 Tax=Xanthoceras sorbifolium TaxID=99658 RepID=A0ABQ8H7X1_9ROSI|nr:hypothetical protein JRO89_XS13G0116600 [Xanthoceras sorbifolium]